MPKFNTTVQLTGEDGNAFAIMAKVKSAIVKAGATPEQVSQYTMDSCTGDYDNLLRVAMEYVNVA
jgi:hypothetical protein